MGIIEDILLLTTDFYGSEDDRVRSVVAAVYHFLPSQLRSGVTPEDCRSAFVPAAAFLAMSYLKVLDHDQLEGFDAGTLKLSFADRSDRLCQLAKTLLAPWCGDRDFAFCGVRA